MFLLDLWDEIFQFGVLNSEFRNYSLNEIALFYVSDRHKTRPDRSGV